MTGDPAQLRHIPFIPQAEQVRAAQRADLSDDEADAFDYRSKSLLDLALQAIPTGREVQFLDEHFRSRPEIIRFANERFYESALRVMTWRPSRDSVRGRCPSSQGVRGANGVNTAEVEALMEFLETRVAAEANLPDAAQSVSDCSPRFAHKSTHFVPPPKPASLLGTGPNMTSRSTRRTASRGMSGMSCFSLGPSVPALRRLVSAT